MFPIRRRDSVNFHVTLFFFPVTKVDICALFFLLFFFFSLFFLLCVRLFVTTVCCVARIVTYYVYTYLGYNSESFREYLFFEWASSKKGSVEYLYTIYIRENWSKVEVIAINRYMNFENFWNLRRNVNIIWMMQLSEAIFLRNFSFFLKLGKENNQIIYLSLR